MNYDKCCYPRCRQFADMTYLEKRICDRHFGMSDTKKLREELKVKNPPKERRT
jgi:hypothetical protein